MVHTQLCFQEEPSNVWFPELQDLPSSVTYMDMKIVRLQRLTGLGCQNGYLQCTLVDLSSNSKNMTLYSALSQVPTQLSTVLQMMKAGWDLAGNVANSLHDVWLVFRVHS